MFKKISMCISALVLGLIFVCVPSFAADEPARVIVKFKPQSGLLRPQVLSAQRAQSQAALLGTRVGLSLRGHARIAEHTQVVSAAGIDAASLAQRLSAEPDIEYAVPDHKRHAHNAPNDPRFASGLGGNGPAIGQWYLRAPSTQLPAAMNAQAAWSLTIGSPNVVVAVLDTGIRFDHEELASVARGGNVLPGYDMISDIDTANDGNSRDSDASDPGDWLSSQDLSPSGAFAVDCGDSPRNSTWHGTQTAALIGALSNNSLGMASVGRTVRILPVRVLGKCGGRDSDIVAGMRWAAGLHVDGIPDNPTPARILNLSLGAPGSCSPVYIEAIQEVNAAGSSVVISAGNTTGEAVSSPANCPGALAVGGLQHTGAKVGYSDLGPEVAISAPAGNCVNTTGPCLYPILTATNSSNAAPVPNNSSYTDSYDYSAGTSFSAPLVAGTAALMLSVQPGLSPAQIKQVLQSTARPFPTTGAVTDTPGGIAPTCTAPQFGAGGVPIQQLQCYCTTATCGAGMLDAAAAVTAAAGTTPAPVVPPAPSRPGFVNQAGSGGSGGGAAGGAWLLGLLTGTVVLLGLQRRARRPVQNKSALF
jgi:serine protease